MLVTMRSNDIEFEKCGDIILAPKSKIFALTCRLCNDVFLTFEDFKGHILQEHDVFLGLTYESDSEEDIETWTSTANEEIECKHTQDIGIDVNSQFSPRNTKSLGELSIDLEASAIQTIDQISRNVEIQKAYESDTTQKMGVFPEKTKNHNQTDQVFQEKGCSINSFLDEPLTNDKSSPNKEDVQKKSKEALEIISVVELSNFKLSLDLSLAEVEMDTQQPESDQCDPARIEYLNEKQTEPNNDLDCAMDVDEDDCVESKIATNSNQASKFETITKLPKEFNAEDNASKVSVKIDGKNENNLPKSSEEPSEDTTRISFNEKAETKTSIQSESSKITQKSDHIGEKDISCQQVDVKIFDESNENLKLAVSEESEEQKTEEVKTVDGSTCLAMINNITDQNENTEIVQTSIVASFAATGTEHETMRQSMQNDFEDNNKYVPEIQENMNPNCSSVCEHKKSYTATKGLIEDDESFTDDEEAIISDNDVGEPIVEKHESETVVQKERKNAAIVQLKADECSTEGDKFDNVNEPMTEVVKKVANKKSILEIEADESETDNNDEIVQKGECFTEGDNVTIESNNFNKSSIEHSTVVEKELKKTPILQMQSDESETEYKDLVILPNNDSSKPSMSQESVTVVQRDTKVAPIVHMEADECDSVALKSDNDLDNPIIKPKYAAIVQKETNNRAILEMDAETDGDDDDVQKEMNDASNIQMEVDKSETDGDDEAVQKDECSTEGKCATTKSYNDIDKPIIKHKNTAIVQKEANNRAIPEMDAETDGDDDTVQKETEDASIIQIEADESKTDNYEEVVQKDECSTEGDSVTLKSDNDLDKPFIKHKYTAIVQKEANNRAILEMDAETDGDDDDVQKEMNDASNIQMEVDRSETDDDDEAVQKDECSTEGKSVTIKSDNDLDKPIIKHKYTAIVQKEANNKAILEMDAETDDDDDAVQKDSEDASIIQIKADESKTVNYEEAVQKDECSTEGKSVTINSDNSSISSIEHEYSTVIRKEANTRAIVEMDAETNGDGDDVQKVTNEASITHEFREHKKPYTAIKGLIEDDESFTDDEEAILSDNDVREPIVEKHESETVVQKERKNAAIVQLKADECSTEDDKFDIVNMPITEVVKKEAKNKSILQIEADKSETDNNDEIVEKGECSTKGKSVTIKLDNVNKPIIMQDNTEDVKKLSNNTSILKMASDESEINGEDEPVQNDSKDASIVEIAAEECSKKDENVAFVAGNDANEPIVTHESASIFKVETNNVSNLQKEAIESFTADDDDEVILSNNDAGKGTLNHESVTVVQKDTSTTKINLQKEAIESFTDDDDDEPILSYNDAGKATLNHESVTVVQKDTSTVHRMEAKKCSVVMLENDIVKQIIENEPATIVENEETENDFVLQLEHDRSSTGGDENDDILTDSYMREKITQSESVEKESKKDSVVQTDAKKILFAEKNNTLTSEVNDDDNIFIESEKLVACETKQIQAKELTSTRIADYTENELKDIINEDKNENKERERLLEVTKLPYEKTSINSSLSQKVNEPTVDHKSSVIENAYSGDIVGKIGGIECKEPIVEAVNIANQYPTLNTVDDSIEYCKNQTSMEITNLMHDSDVEELSDIIEKLEADKTSIIEDSVDELGSQMTMLHTEQNKLKETSFKSSDDIDDEEQLRKKNEVHKNVEQVIDESTNYVSGNHNSEEISLNLDTAAEKNNDSINSTKIEETFACKEDYPTEGSQTQTKSKRLSKFFEDLIGDELDLDDDDEELKNVLENIMLREEGINEKANQSSDNEKIVKKEEIVNTNDLEEKDDHEQTEVLKKTNNINDDFIKIEKNKTKAKYMRVKEKKTKNPDLENIQNTTEDLFSKNEIKNENKTEQIKEIDITAAAQEEINENMRLISKAEEKSFASNEPIDDTSINISVQDKTKDNTVNENVVSASKKRKRRIYNTKCLDSPKRQKIVESMQTTTETEFIETVELPKTFIAPQRAPLSPKNPLLGLNLPKSLVVTKIAKNTTSRNLQSVESEMINTKEEFPNQKASITKILQEEIKKDQKQFRSSPKYKPENRPNPVVRIKRLKLESFKAALNTEKPTEKLTSQPMTPTSKESTFKTKLKKPQQKNPIKANSDELPEVISTPNADSITDDETDDIIKDILADVSGKLDMTTEEASKAIFGTVTQSEDASTLELHRPIDEVFDAENVLERLGLEILIGGEVKRAVSDKFADLLLGSKFFGRNFKEYSNTAILYEILKKLTRNTNELLLSYGKQPIKVWELKCIINLLINWLLKEFSNPTKTTPEKDQFRNYFSFIALKRVYLCEHCVLIFNYESKYESHLKTHTNPKSGMTCEICLKTLKRASAFEAHVEKCKLQSLKK